MLLRQFRYRTGLKQEAMAEEIGVSQGYYSRLESGQLLPSAAVHERIIALFGNPYFETAAERWRKSVKYSYTAASMIFAARGTVRLLEFSQGLREMGGVYASARTGDVLENALSEDADHQFSQLKAYGAFDGAVAVVRNIWNTGSADTGKYFKAVTTIFPDAAHKFVLFSQHSEISKTEYNSYDASERFSVIER